MARWSGSRSSGPEAPASPCSPASSARSLGAAGHPPRPPLLVARAGSRRPTTSGWCASASCSRATAGSSTATTAAPSSCGPSSPTRSSSSTCPAACASPGRCGASAPRPAGPRLPAAVDREFLRWIWDFPTQTRPRCSRVLGTYAATTDVVQLRSRAEVREFLARLRADWRTAPESGADRSAPPSAMMAAVKRIGLVLGAGGLTGQAFHAGVLDGAGRGDGLGPARRVGDRRDVGRRRRRRLPAARASAAPTSPRCSRSSR